jgi:hypothetical protein
VCVLVCVCVCDIVCVYVCVCVSVCDVCVVASGVFTACSSRQIVLNISLLFSMCKDLRHVYVSADFIHGVFNVFN